MGGSIDAPAPVYGAANHSRQQPARYGGAVVASPCAFCIFLLNDANPGPAVSWPCLQVDPALVGEALQKYLGRPSPQPEPQPSYTWDMAPLSR